MQIRANKYETSIKNEVVVSYDKPLFDMDKLASKATINKYDKYFRTVDSFEDEVQQALYEIEHDLETGNTTTNFKEAYETGKTFLLSEMVYSVHN